MSGNQKLHENREVFEEAHVVPVLDNDSGNEFELMDESDDDCNESCSNQASTNPDNEEPRSDSTGSIMRYEVSIDLGEYWDLQNRTVSTREADMVLRMITDYNKLTASHNIPQYGFKKGFHMFEEDRYKAMVSELKDNLVGRGCVKMLNKMDVNGEIRKKALAYLMFLKQKQSGKVKACGCADGHPQR